MKIAKPCQRCGKKLVVRTNGETGVEFLGCSEYPECTYSEPLPNDILMRRLGAPELPGFGAVDDDSKGDDMGLYNAIFGKNPGPNPRRSHGDWKGIASGAFGRSPCTP